MKTDRKKQITIVAILLVVIASVSIGFAAFSGVLNISSSASVNPNANTFAIKFSSSETALETNNITPVLTPSTLTGKPAVINNDGAPTLTNLSVDFTEPGQKAVYNLWVRNDGEYLAYLTGIKYGLAEGSTKFKKCTADATANTTQSLVDEACNGIKVTVQVGSTSATGSMSVTNHSLAKETHEAVTVTIEYESNSARADGRFTVAFGDISLIYSSLDETTIVTTSPAVTNAEGYLSAVGLSLANTTVNNGTYNVLETGNVCLSSGNTADNCSDTLEVELDGTMPSGGVVSVYNGTVAYVEGLNYGTSKVSSGFNGSLIESDYRQVCQAVTETTRIQDKHYAFSGYNSDYSTKLSTELSYIGNIPEGSYEPGDEYICQVKSGVQYRFYVLSTNITDNTVNLIMDQNITSDGTPATTSNTGTVEWISQTDYLASGGSACTSVYGQSECAKIDKGPITAMNFLSNAVSDWSNIPEQNLSTSIPAVQGKWDVDDNHDALIYEPDLAYQINMKTRARMIFVSEAYDAGCEFEVNRTETDGTVSKYFFNTCPLWLSNNLQFKEVGVPVGATQLNGVRGYWTMQGVHDDGSNSLQTAFEVYDHVNMNATYVNRTNYNGVRPVITLSKNYLK